MLWKSSSDLYALDNIASAPILESGESLVEEMDDRIANYVHNYAGSVLWLMGELLLFCKIRQEM